MSKFAVFDIDGTLVRWQLYHAVVDQLSKINALEPGAETRIHEARMKWKRRKSTNEFRTYEVCLIKEYERAIQKLDTKTFDTVVLKVINEYKDQVYTYTRQLLEKLKSQGYTLLAISGSHAELVAHIADYYGFNDFIATTYDRTATGFSGKVSIGSHNKKDALQKLVKKHGLEYKDSYAIGDSRSDAAMLELVENPIAFNPELELFETAKKAGWKIVIERKNVIYTLEPHDGKYVLA